MLYDFLQKSAALRMDVGRPRPKTALLGDGLMPRLRVRNPIVPSSLKGWVVVGDGFQPRFWATIWADILLGVVVGGTRGRHLSAVEKLYRCAAAQLHVDCLDSIIGALDFDALEAVLGGFLTMLHNESAVDAVDRDETWQTALRFVDDIMHHLGLTSGERIDEVSARLLRLKRLFSQISPTPPRPPTRIRALPIEVIEELYDLINPDSPRNPFRTPALRFRNLLLFLLLLHLGLRRGECLVLRVDAIKEDFDPSNGKIRYWINVDETPWEDAGEDPRSDRPSLKTEQSRRQLPIPAELLRVADVYAQNYRGSPPHGFLLNSQKNGPLATRTVQDVFEVLTERLSERAKKVLKERGWDGVTAHACRHSSAVHRLARYREQGFDHDEAIDKLRVFFGWSPQSQMPRHYARAYWETSLDEVWNESFDSFVETLRGITREQETGEQE